jgi:spore germination protein YaaH
VYQSNTRDYKINLAWHAVAGTAGNDTLTTVMQNTKSINVISPTWFALSDNEGNFTSFATQDYVTQAHNMGLEVWGLIDNFTNADVDTYEVLVRTD